MIVNSMFRCMPSSYNLHGYAQQKLQVCEQRWKRKLDLRLAFIRNMRGVQVQLCGRDLEGHFISCHGQGVDGFRAVDNLCRKLEPQGLLLAQGTSSPSLNRHRSPKSL